MAVAAGKIKNVIEALAGAQIVVASSPTYRATYTGLLKTFFDLLPQDCLIGKIGVPILTGGGPWHQLALDHGFRPLFASLGATVVNGAYGYDAQFKNGPEAALLAKIDEMVEDALVLARTIAESKTGAGSVTDIPQSAIRNPQSSRTGAK